MPSHVFTSGKISSFFRELNNIHICAYISHFLGFSTHSFINGHLARFHVVTSVNNGKECGGADIFSKSLVFERIHHVR